MAKALIDVIKDRRRELKNPYAYMDELIELQAMQTHKRLLENPHAYVDEIDRLTTHVSRFDSLETAASAPPRESIPSKPAKHSDQEIEQLARQIQIKIWRMLKAAGATEPLITLDPFRALEEIGYQVEIPESLGTYGSGSQAIEVAGLINSKSRTVRISGQQPIHVRNFTAAHELGHALLHPGMELHRDKPLDRARNSREQHEYEADKFATFFLMPRKLVAQTFEEIYGPAPFKLTESSSFALSRSLEAGKKNFSSLRDLSLLLSSTGTYNGLQFVPLHQRFQVSSLAMAIRLEELKLIEFN